MNAPAPIPANLRATQTANARFLPETKHKSKRVVVTFSASKIRHTFSRHHPELDALPSDDRMLATALRLALQKMDWRGTWVIGATKDGGIVATCQEPSSTFTV